MDLLRAVSAEIRLPAFAIGGITAANVAQVRAAGFTRIAVSASVTAASEPGQAAAQLRGFGRLTLRRTVHDLAGSAAVCSNSRSTSVRISRTQCARSLAKIREWRPDDRTRWSSDRRSRRTRCWWPSARPDGSSRLDQHTWAA